MARIITLSFPDVEEELFQRLKHYHLEKDLSRGYVIRRALQEFLDKVDPKPKEDA